MAEWRAERRVDGTWHVAHPDRESPLVAEAITDARGAVWVHVDGDVFVEEPPDRPRSERRAPGTADLEAPMPAQVTAVLVEAGDVVEEGAVLILLDAMKMELPLRAPFAAHVRAVHCAPGERVAPGRPLVDLGPREDHA